MGYEIISIQPADKHLIEGFLKNAGISLKKFRYFNSRPLEVIKNHLITLIVLMENSPVGYGHLDQEGEKVWLGTAVAEAEIGKGLGKMIMKRLLEEAKKLGVKKITLTVDNDNAPAIALYLKCGFELIRMDERISFYEVTIK